METRVYKKRGEFAQLGHMTRACDDAYFWATHQGAESDLILRRNKE